MHDLLPFIVAGIATGSIYGLAASGLVLTYKTSGIFNFGHGALATAAAYCFYWLHYREGLNWGVAIVLAVLVAGPVMGLAMERIGRRLALQSTASKIVATVGLIVLVQGLATVKYGSDTIRLAQYLPSGTHHFRIGGVNVQYAQLTVTLVGLAAVGLLYGLFRRTRMGIAMRAVVDDPDLLAMQATSPVLVRRWSWVIGSTFAALAGVLVLPFVGLNAIALTFLVVQAFGAAALGAFDSIPLTYVGALVIGVGANLSQKYVVNVTWLAGLPDSLPFIVLFVVLLVLPRRKLVPRAAVEHRPPLQWRGPAPVRLAGGAAVLVVLAVLPQVVGARHLGFFTIGLTQMIMVLSLGLLVRTSGQVSLCHATFAAIGAVAFSQLAAQHGVPWLAALVLASLIAVPVGALVAIPAIRLSGLFLALATFGFGIMVERLLYARGFMFTVLESGRPMPRPSWGSSNHGYYYVVLAFVAVTAVTMVVIHEARIGRLLRGLADSPVAVGTLGLSTNTTRVIVFCVSSFFAAMSGALYGSSVHFATTADSHFTAFNSLILLALLALAPFAEPWYALFALIAAVIPGYLTGANTANWLNVVFGVSAVSVALRGGHPAMPARLQSFFEQFRRHPAPHTPTLPQSLPPRAPVGAAASAAHPAPLERSAVATPRSMPGPPAATGLAARGLSVHFGGLVAVDAFSFDAPVGRVTGLIGPNGAGKTSTFDACSGLNRRIGGQVLLHGRDVTGLGPAARGRLGLGRTFQRMQLAERLTVEDNVALGREAALAGARVLSQLAARPADSRETRDATAAALELCGISDLAGTQAGALSTGQRRLVELARCLAGSFDVMMLDEPSSGLDRDETAAFDEVLRRVVAERGCGVLLVEHDMSLVMNVCSYIYVLDFGRLIFEGDPAAVAASATVQAAYLGTGAVVGVAVGGDR
ncbi:MAG TPA: branched-chain amino acid ABC transporter permease/ATP-binding protein [Acidimicrobiales bacterium]|nr:branched-chain amino acid ABC transporter permease/ATP-binding protein [Acidimicrobiales bacterium]